MTENADSWRRQDGEKLKDFKARVFERFPPEKNAGSYRSFSSVDKHLTESLLADIQHRHEVRTVERKYTDAKERIGEVKRAGEHNEMQRQLEINNDEILEAWGKHAFNKKKAAAITRLQRAQGKPMAVFSTNRVRPGRGGLMLYRSIVWSDRPQHNLTLAKAREVVALLETGKSYYLNMRSKYEDGKINQSMEPHVVGRSQVIRVDQKDPERLAKALHHWAETMWGGATHYPITRSDYALTEMKDPAQAGPFWHTDDEAKWVSALMNCVSRHVEATLMGPAKAGQPPKGLSRERAAFLKQMDKRVAGKGCTLKDLDDMEKGLKVLITVKAVTGCVIRESKRKSKWSKVEFIGHNFHAFPSALTFPDLTKVKVLTFDPDKDFKRDDRKRTEVEEKKYRAAADKRADKMIWEIAAASKAARVWFIGPHALVTSEGIMFKTEQTHWALDSRIRDEVGWCEADQYDAPDEIVAKYDERAAEAKPCVSVMAYDYKRFRHHNGLSKTRADRCDMWRAACVEHKVWDASEMPTTESLFQIDMRACFPSFATPTNEAYPYYLEFGWTTRDVGLHFSVNAEVDAKRPEMNLPGLAEVTAWRFHDGLHEYIPGLFGEHFSTKKWTPIALLAYMLREGILDMLAVGNVYLVSEDKKSRESVWWPAENRPGKSTQNTAREMLGYMTRHPQSTTVFIRDLGEADYVIKQLVEEKRFSTTEQRPDIVGKLIHYHDDGAPRATYVHARASFLAYAHIALLKMLVRFEPTRVYRVVTDALYLPEDGKKLPDVGIKPAGGRTVADHCKWGEWRVKPVLTKFEPAKIRHWDIALLREGKNTTDAKEVYPPYETEFAHLMRNQVTYVYGQGGNGKTTSAVRAFKGRSSVVVLAPTNLLAANHHTEHGGVLTSTYHMYLHISCGMARWSPHVMREKQSQYHDIVIWDEICLVPTSIILPTLNYLINRGSKVILCGDPGQLPPHKEKHGAVEDGTESFHNRVMSGVDPRIVPHLVEQDYRAKTEELKALKVRMWMQPEKIQQKEMRAFIPPTTYDEFLEAWNPADRIVCPSNALCNKFANEVMAIHRDGYPDSPLRIVYGPEERKAGAAPPPGSLDLAEDAKIYKGTVAHIPLPEEGEPLPEDWDNGQTTTGHSMQGTQVLNPAKLWIVDEGYGWTTNYAYTVVSRVQDHEQLRRVVLKQEERPIPPVTEDSKNNRILKKIERYKATDIEKKYPKACDLTVGDVLLLGKLSESKCAECKRVVFWDGYRAFDEQQFSIDRLNNHLGHTRDNVRLVCLKCNSRNIRGGDRTPRIAGTKPAPSPTIMPYNRYSLDDLY